MWRKVLRLPIAVSMAAISAFIATCGAPTPRQTSIGAGASGGAAAPAAGTGGDAQTGGTGTTSGGAGGLSGGTDGAANVGGNMPVAGGMGTGGMASTGGIGSGGTNAGGASGGGAPGSGGAAPVGVINLTLINAATDTVIAAHNPVQSGATLSFAALGTNQINLRANCPGPVGSVVFTLNGAAHAVENTQPYALSQDSLGDYHPWTPAPGSYTVTARAFESDDGAGAPIGPVHSSSFTIAP